VLTLGLVTIMPTPRTIRPITVNDGQAPRRYERLRASEFRESLSPRVKVHKEETEPMAKIVPRKDSPSRDSGRRENDHALPLRWAVILITALGGGLAVGGFSGLFPGVTVGLAIAGFLHQALPVLTPGDRPEPPANDSES
jgi:hypothetical protein